MNAEQSPPGAETLDTKSAAPDQTVVLFGNTAPLMQIPEFAKNEDGDWEPTGRTRGEPAKHINQSVTRVEMWSGFDDPEFVEHTLSTDNDRILMMIARGLDQNERKYAVGIAEMEQLHPAHSADSKPAWISSSDPEFAKALAKHFGCPANDFQNVDGAQIGGPTALLTNAGRDAFHAQHMSTAAQPAAFNYMGLANNATATAPAAGDTVLTGEITTAGGGLIRAQATYAHTAGTNTSTLTKTFTANGTDSLPVTVSQMGIFNAVTAGTISYKTALNSNATLNISGDNVTVTETVTAG